MITYEEAKTKALKNMPEANSVAEYKDAYVFYNSKARGNAREDNEVVILKATGKIISYSEYIMQTKDNNPPKTKAI